MELVRQVVVEWLALLCRSLTFTGSNLNMDIVFLTLDFSHYPQFTQLKSGMILTRATSASSLITHYLYHSPELEKEFVNNPRIISRTVINLLSSSDEK